MTSTRQLLPGAKNRAALVRRRAAERCRSRVAVRGGALVALLVQQQPWLFLYETDGPDRTLFDSVLMPRNRAWASKAPLVGFIFANTRTPDGREPRTAQFDTGAAWMALTLQLRAEDYVIAAKIAGMREAGIIGNSCCRAS